jgi:hypothetical protein
MSPLVSKEKLLQYVGELYDQILGEALVSSVGADLLEERYENLFGPKWWEHLSPINKTWDEKNGLLKHAVSIFVLDRLFDVDPSRRRPVTDGQVGKAIRVLKE